MMQKRKSNIIFNTAVVLFLLVCLSTRFLLTGLNARFISGDVNNDSARVATFSITADSTDISSQMYFVMAPQVHTHTVNVVNNSEVDVQYTISVTNTTGSIPLEFSIVDDPALNVGPFDPGYSSNSDTLEIGESATYYININFPVENATDHMGKIDLVTINVHAEQID